MDKEEARVRLIALAETTPKGVQRDALVMGANALINDIANQWLKEHDTEVRAKVFDECIEEVWRISKSTTAVDKHMLYEYVVRKLERLKEQK